MTSALNPNHASNGKNGLNIDLPTDVYEFFSKKRVLVTGGTGMIGRQVIKLLKTAECEITCVSLDNLSWDDGVNYIKADITSFQRCCEITKDQQIVLHIAGIKGSINVINNIEYIAADVGPERGIRCEFTLVEVTNILLSNGFLIKNFCNNGRT